MGEAILVTGGSGFVGRAVVRALRNDPRSAGAPLVQVTDAPTQDDFTVPARRDDCGRYELTAHDLVERGINRIDRVIHLGAATPKLGAQGDDPSAAMANVINLDRLVDALPNKPARFVFASTLDVYGVAGADIDETTVCQPASLYGAAKLFGERWLAARFPEVGVLQTLRLGHIYGPGEAAYRKFIPESIRRLLRGEPPRFVTDGRELRSFLHVEDCARMIVAAAFAPDSAGPVNLGSRRTVPLVEVARILCDIHRAAGGAALRPEFADDPRKGADLTLATDRMRAMYGEEQMTLEDGLTGEYRAMAAAE